MTFRPTRSRPLLVVPLLVLAACTEGVGPAAGGPWSQVTAGDLFTCALARDGTAWCWGAGNFGQLGNNLTVTEPIPVKVVGGLVFRSLSAGNSHVCGLTLDGAAWCWGVGTYGELGATTSYCNNNVRFVDCSAVPVAVAGGLAFDSIVAAAYSTCALARDGAAWCWGYNDHGQLGTGAAVLSSVAVPTRVTGRLLFQSITMDVNHACGLTAQSVLYCWGSNDFGQLAADTLVTPRCGVGAGFYCTSSPVASAAGLAASAMSAGRTHTCAIAGGDTYCWGSNEYGVLGDPAAPGGRTPVRVLGGHAFAQVSAGADHTCALDQAGAAFCWGLDTFGQLAVSGPSSACPAFGSMKLCEMSPVAAQGIAPLAAISAGSGHTCGLALDGEIWCWGLGEEGQLGDGQSATNAAPVRVVHP